MIVQSFHLHAERINPEKNMARFYTLDIQPTLFGEVSLVRSWGRIGTRGQRVVKICDDEQHAIRLFVDLLREKRRRGYRPKLSGNSG